jgi:DNA-binding NarL/FixJ family response regulator
MKAILNFALTSFVLAVIAEEETVMRVLVIDDDQNLLENISIMLEIAGYEVLRANNGVEGLRLIHDYRPGLIVCDVLMPDMSGYEVLEELRANSEMVSTPIIFLTSKSDMHDIRRGMQAGVDDYLTKPFTEQDLLATIQVVLEKRHQWELQKRIAFAHDLVQTYEQESQRIARQLDQGFRQKLLNMKFYLDAQTLNRSAFSETLMVTMQNSLEELLTEVTMLSYALYPVMLAHLGLIATLQWYFNTVQQRLNISVQFETYDMDARLADGTEIIFYRITQRVMEFVTSAQQSVRVVLWRDENTIHYSIAGLPLSAGGQTSLLQLLEEYGYTIRASVVLQRDDDAKSVTVFVTLPDAVFQQPEPSAALPQFQQEPVREQVPNTRSLNLDALLTRREREIMELILHDMTHADIAARLVISPRTVEKHRANMMQKLALNTHTELILFALRHGLMSPA